MDRIEFREKMTKCAKNVRLDEMDKDVHIKKLSALDRAKWIDRYKALNKNDEAENAFEKMTVETQCYLITRCLVDESGARIYTDGEEEKAAEEITGTALDQLSKEILNYSGLGKEDEQPKNLIPTLSADSSSVLQ